MMNVLYRRVAICWKKTGDYNIQPSGLPRGLLIGPSIRIDHSLDARCQRPINHNPAEKTYQYEVNEAYSLGGLVAFGDHERRTVLVWCAGSRVFLLWVHVPH